LRFESSFRPPLARTLTANACHAVVRAATILSFVGGLSELRIEVRIERARASPRSTLVLQIGRVLEYVKQIGREIRRR
jgi:hypothetical protein